MKKWYAILGLCFATLMNAQCNIYGKNTLQVGETEAYSVDVEAAQCKDCHLWTYTGNGISLRGDNRQNAVSVGATQAGRAVVSVTYLSSKGIATCSKNIDVVGAGSSYTPNHSNPTNGDAVCDVNVDNFKEVKVDQGIVSFFPMGDQSNFNYEWTALYFDGTTKTSSEKVPQFTYSAKNGIFRISAKITSKICYKNLSKTYESRFWSTFK